MDPENNLWDYVNGRGRYQWFMCFLLGLNIYVNAFFDMGAIFLAAEPDHWCRISALADTNWTVAEQRQISIPRSTRDGQESYSECSYYNKRNYSYLSTLPFDEALDYAQNETDTSTAACTAYDYDHTDYGDTTVTEWDLVCDKTFLLSTIQGSYMAGVLVGALIFGYISDRFGRRLSILIAVTVHIVAAVGTAFSPNYSVFIAFRFVTAMCMSGSYLVGYVLLMELVASNRRALYGMLYQVPFGFGYMSLALFAYFIRDWRMLELAISVPCVAFLFYYWVVPESPRWLIINGRLSDAEVVLSKAAKFNKKTDIEAKKLRELTSAFSKSEEAAQRPIATISSPDRDATKEKCCLCCNKHAALTRLSNIFIMVRTPEMRKRTIIMYFNWIVVAMTYYGVALNSTNLPANPYVVNIIMGAVEIPAYIGTAPIVERFGRRVGMCGSMLLSGLSLMLVLAVPSSLPWLSVALSFVGKLTITAAFGLVYLYTAELFPTEARNIGVGGASMSARIGSIVAPYIVDMLGSIHYAIPSTIFGILSLVSGAVSLFLPETNKKTLPETIAEIEITALKKLETVADSNLTIPDTV